MKKLYKILSLVYFFVLMCFIAMAQVGQDSDSINTLRESNKIYVVILVLLTVLIGIFYMVLRIESKVEKLEKNSLK